MAGNAEFKEAIEELNRARQDHGVEVKGSLYSMVKDRIETFRRMWGNKYGINTDTTFTGFNEGDVIVVSAKVTEIVDRELHILASGMAMERIQGIHQNEMSWNACIEATETKAIGRALACFGLHGGEYASDAEMAPVAQRHAEEPSLRHEPMPDPDDERVHFDKPRAETPVNADGVPLYVPSWSDIQNKDPDALMGPILTSIGQIEDMHFLTLYWSALEEFRSTLPDNLFQELKDFFKETTKEIGANHVSQ